MVRPVKNVEESRIRQRRRRKKRSRRRREREGEEDGGKGKLEWVEAAADPASGIEYMTS